MARFIKESWNKGKHNSKESNRKNSESNKGKIPWNVGLTKEIDERVAKMYNKEGKTLQ